MSLAKFLVFDLETGGLDPATCGITEISGGVFVRDPGGAPGVDMIARCSSILRPIPGMVYEARALEIQGRTLKDLEGGVGIGTAVGRLRALVEDEIGPPKTCSPWAHNAPFDTSFLGAACERWNLTYPFNRTYRCSMALFRALQDAGHHECYRANLDAVCTCYNIEIAAEERHTALGDLKATALAIDRMMRCIEVQAPAARFVARSPARTAAQRAIDAQSPLGEQR